MSWTSVRNESPNDKGTYQVKDCRHNVQCQCYYDGYNWDTPEFPVVSKNKEEGYVITHWREVE